MTDKTEVHVELFTDRSIYRPGQTLHYSGIVYSQRMDDVRAKEGEVYTIRLMDADGKLVQKQEESGSPQARVTTVEWARRAA